MYKLKTSKLLRVIEALSILGTALLGVTKPVLPMIAVGVQPENQGCGTQVLPEYDGFCL